MNEEATEQLYRKHIAEIDDETAKLVSEQPTILLPETTLAGAQVVAEQIRISIENSRIRRADCKEFIGNITISAGVAVYLPEPGETAVEWIAWGDAALYTAKTEGRNRIAIANQTKGT